ncbi:hypothetical protein NQZ68_003087 [Dissostichus eleginoides]|nr:hypothetical protein NQZ68_003087 [Dissostichus eleginoides]
MSLFVADERLKSLPSSHGSFKHRRFNHLIITTTLRKRRREKHLLAKLNMSMHGAAVLPGANSAELQVNRDFKPRRAAPSSRLSVVHGPVVALMLTGREEAPGDEGTQTTRIYAVPLGCANSPVRVWVDVSIGDCIEQQASGGWRCLSHVHEAREAPWRTSWGILPSAALRD